MEMIFAAIKGAFVAFIIGFLLAWVVEQTPLDNGFVKIVIVLGAPFVGGYYACSKVKQERQEFDRWRTNALEKKTREEEEKRQQKEDREAKRKMHNEYDERNRKTRRERYVRELEEFRVSLRDMSPARLQSLAARTRDELREAKSQLRHEERENQKAIRQKDDWDDDIYRRCQNIEEEAEEIVNQAKRRLEVVEGLL